MIPWQLGPNTRTLCFLALARNASWSLFPSSPISLNPAELMMTALTPFFPHSSMAWGTSLAGMMMWATSTSPGISSSAL
jgi:hypothetical protein